MSGRRRRSVLVIGTSVATLALAATLYMSPPAAPISTVAAEPALASALTAPGESATFAFLTPSTGWAAASISGEHRLWIYATADGARSWRAVGAIDDLVYPSPVSTFEFFDRAHGILVVAPDELVYLTDDGGRSWAPVELPANAAYVTFIDPLVGWATTGFTGAGAMQLFVTNDAGTSWQRLPNLPVDGFPVFRSLTEGWLAGPAGTHIVYTTNDSGQSWAPHHLPSSPCPSDCAYATGTLGAVELLPGTGAMATDASTGAAFVSFDFGETWRFVVPPPTPTSPGDYSKDSFEDALHWWAIGGNELYKTSDAGATWTLVSDRIVYDTVVPTILDNRHAWAQIQTRDDLNRGYDATVAWQLDVTVDGGLNWKDVTVPVPD